MHAFWKAKHPPLQPFHFWNAHSLLLTFDHMHKLSSPLTQSEEAFTICIQSLNNRIGGNSFVLKPGSRALWDNMVKNENNWFHITATCKVHRKFVNTIGFYLIGEAHKREGIRAQNPTIHLIWSLMVGSRALTFINIQAFRYFLCSNDRPFAICHMQCLLSSGNFSASILQLSVCIYITVLHSSPQKRPSMTHYVNVALLYFMHSPPHLCPYGSDTALGLYLWLAANL
jgi:hypothetical protein